jgi:tetratricopeptide (TPR) repeat protein
MPPDLRPAQEVWVTESLEDLSQPGKRWKSPKQLPFEAAIEQLGGEAAPIRAERPFEVCRLFREQWEKRAASEKWPYALRASVYLRQYALLIGDPTMVQLAVDLLKASAIHHRDQVETDHQIALALTDQGRLERRSDLLAEAIEKYRNTLGGAASAGAVLLERIRVNLAVALTALADCLGEQARMPHLDEAEHILRSALRSPHLALQDRSRTHQNLGIVLTQKYRNAVNLNRPEPGDNLIDEAIAAYAAARHEILPSPRKSDEDAAILNDLSMAYLEKRMFGKALEICRQALALQPRDRVPMAWSRSKDNEAQILGARSQSEPSPKAIQSLRESCQAFQQARQSRPQAWNPIIWAETTARLSTTTWGLANRLLLSEHNFDRITGLAYLEYAVLIGNEAIYYLDNSMYSSFCVILSIISKDLNFNLGVISKQYIMDSRLKSKILAVLIPTLDDLAVDPHARSALLQELAADISAQSPDAAAEEITQRERKVDAATGKTKPLPAPPPGHQWPTETYSGSPEAKRGGGGIVAYLERVWLPLLQAAPGAIDLPTLRAVDPSAAFGINNYARNGRTLPLHLEIPTKRAVNDRLLSQGPRAILNDPRLAQVVATRIREGRKVPGF